MAWGEGPLNVWNMLLGLILIGLLVWGLFGEVEMWRARTREYLEEQAALQRGDHEAARRQIAHGILCLLVALVGLVVVLLGPHRTSRIAWHAGWLTILFFGPGAAILFRRGVRAHRKHKPQGSA